MTKTKTTGEWKIEEVKRGFGFKAVFYPSGYGPSLEGPSFPTQQEVQTWIDKALQKRSVKNR